MNGWPPSIEIVTAAEGWAREQNWRGPSRIEDDHRAGDRNLRRADADDAVPAGQR